MEVFREIKLVGFVDWVWFVFYLKRDEFSNKLDLNRYYPNLEKLIIDRNRAHAVDSAISKMKKDKV